MSPSIFPSTILVRVQPPDGGPAKLLDVSSDEPTTYFIPTLPNVPYGSVDDTEEQEAGRPSSVAAILTRSSGNIRSFTYHERRSEMLSSAEVYDAAHYAVDIWDFMTDQGIHAIPAFPPMSKVLDSAAVLQDGLCPILPPELRHVVGLHLHAQIDADESSAHTVKLRSQSPNIQFFVGLPMVHRKYDYVGVIYGWDVGGVFTSRCSMIGN